MNGRKWECCMAKNTHRSNKPPISQRVCWSTQQSSLNRYCRFINKYQRERDHDSKPMSLAELTKCGQHRKKGWEGILPAKWSLGSDKFCKRVTATELERFASCWRMECASAPQKCTPPPPPPPHHHHHLCPSPQKSGREPYSRWHCRPTAQCISGIPPTEYSQEETTIFTTGHLVVLQIKEVGYLIKIKPVISQTKHRGRVIHKIHIWFLFMVSLQLMFY